MDFGLINSSEPFLLGEPRLYNNLVAAHSTMYKGKTRFYFSFILKFFPLKPNKMKIQWLKLTCPAPLQWVFTELLRLAIQSAVASENPPEHHTKKDRSEKACCRSFSPVTFLQDPSLHKTTQVLQIENSKVYALSSQGFGWVVWTGKLKRCFFSPFKSRY